ncbi:MAG: single-stranded-DNA-specific exonuclease RecJ [Clostridiales bacterium]|nr:single-stranded-DNA-specific exonuclease RecJ [Clostridiales bacterium]
MKRILPEFEFSAEQLNIISRLAAECNLCEDTVKILYARGVTDRESIINFLHPSQEHFISPFKMDGMREAVELITRARNEEWCVVVYGDYDADGICASTVMGNALRDFGIEPVLCVPERRNGYGLSVELIDMLFEEYFPQLIITVDCGISCAHEVEYIKEQGAEVIVTDHHELPENIPDCICINPKFNDGYIYDNLCGAGVAFKVACALLGDKAYKYLDFTAIATVADSVPLTGENRDIVYEGLKLINEKPRSCYSQFFKSDGGITSQTLAFSIAPRINAAGRMGDAKSALDLFNETDESVIFDLASKLTSYNIERQKYCDELYVSAKEMLAEEGVNGKIIILAGDSWNSGFVGIVAARLADEFCRPVILFVRNGDMLRGSARSVENVNIFEALKACEQFITEFGGHSQAAGVNVSAENFNALKTALNEYMSTAYTDEDFIPTVRISGVLNGEYSPRFAKELEMLEPFGVGNKRPVFMIEERAANIRSGKAQSNHLSISDSRIDLMYFGGSRYTALIESGAPKNLIFEYNVSNFRGREYVKGFVREVIYGREAGKYAAEEIALNGIVSLAYPCGTILKPITKEEIERAMSECSDFGTLFIAYEYDDIARFENSYKLEVDLFLPSAKNFASGILISPQPDADLSGYSRIICLNNCPVYNPSLEGKTVEYCNGGAIPSYLYELSTKREDLLKIFSSLCANVNNIRGSNVSEVAKYNDLGFPAMQSAFALNVFLQLGLISFESGSLTIYRGIKTELTNSSIYNIVRTIQAEANK